MILVTKTLVVLDIQSLSTCVGDPLRDGPAQFQVGAPKEFAHISSCGDGVVRLRFAVLIVLLCAAGSRLAFAAYVIRTS